MALPVVYISEEILSLRTLLRTENAAIFVSACRPMRRIIRVAFSAGGAMTAQHAREMDNVDQSEDGRIQGQREKQIHERVKVREWKRPHIRRHRGRPQVLQREHYTVNVCRMSHRIRRESKQDPSRARSGNQISCCLVSLHFLCGILTTHPVCRT